MVKIIRPPHVTIEEMTAIWAVHRYVQCYQELQCKTTGEEPIDVAIEIDATALVPTIDYPCEDKALYMRLHFANIIRGKVLDIHDVKILVAEPRPLAIQCILDTRHGKEYEVLKDFMFYVMSIPRDIRNWNLLAAMNRNGVENACREGRSVRRALSHYLCDTNTIQ